MYVNCFVFIFLSAFNRCLFIKLGKTSRKKKIRKKNMFDIQTIEKVLKFSFFLSKN